MIQLSTTLYEKNFRQILNDQHWFFQIKSDYITSKVFIINNITNDSRPELEILKKKFSNQAFFFESNDISKNALLRFKSKMEKNDISWWYSIQYFCQLYVALEQSIEFVFNVGADCVISDLNIDNYLSDSMEILQVDFSILLTTMPWSPGDFKLTGENEQNYFKIKKRHENFWMSKVVSDQVFLCSPSKLLEVDFNIRKNLHPFPKYGGYTFERCLTNFLIKKDFFRAIYKGEHYYTHKSF